VAVRDWDHFAETHNTMPLWRDKAGELRGRALPERIGHYDQHWRNKK
jgi:hypothetical protein